MVEINLFQIIRYEPMDVYLAKVGTIEINIRNEFGQSMLHESVTYRKRDIALDLIAREIDVNLQDKMGRKALHYIAHHPDLPLAVAIIQSGGDLNIADRYGNMPLWYAVFNARGIYDLVKLFVAHWADPDAKNHAGRSPLDFAIQINDQELIGILRSVSR